MRRFSYRRRGRGFARRVARISRAAAGITLAKRIVFDNETIADASSANYDTATTIDLLECTEAQTETAISDGSTVADVPLYSKLKSMKLDLTLDSAAACKVRWMLYKKPNGLDIIAALTGGLADANFHGALESQNAILLRKYTLAKGIVAVPSDRLLTRLKVFVSRKAWERASPMREDDKISLVFAKDTAGTTAALNGFGTIWVKANG